MTPPPSQLQSTSGFLWLPLEMHTQCAANMTDDANITMVLASARFPAVASLYPHELCKQKPNLKGPYSQADSAKRVPTLADFRHVISLLPPHAFEQPIWDSNILPLPGGVDGSCVPVDIRITHDARILDRVRFGSNGATCLGVVEGNIAAPACCWNTGSGPPLTLLRRCDGHVSTACNTRKLMQTILEHPTATTIFTPVQCCVHLMHDPDFTAIGARMLSWMWAMIRNPPNRAGQGRCTMAAVRHCDGYPQLAWGWYQGAGMPSSRCRGFDAFLRIRYLTVSLAAAAMRESA
ncbi:hypothetical protein FN846DRAFT_914230 [Sphaerosporella brunnea]|uniref:Uncharacterized protein n=1 Tax=Sphaerosporella brunnea TaxID=1250544 RepID=A0A5J5EDF3_9PEZI|nr:hypothetical protein FN846DRAFT_914230 [Sphaerosporella brunnea]